MPFRVEPDPTFADRLEQAGRPLVGMWVCSGSPLVAEICAGSGLDWLLIDAEHSPNGLESILPSCTPSVRNRRWSVPLRTTRC